MAGLAVTATAVSLTMIALKVIGALDRIESHRFGFEGYTYGLWLRISLSQLPVCGS